MCPACSVVTHEFLKIVIWSCPVVLDNAQKGQIKLELKSVDTSVVVLTNKVSNTGYIHTYIHTLIYLPSDFRVAYAANISEHLTIR